MRVGYLTALLLVMVCIAGCGGNPGQIEPAGALPAAEPNAVSPPAAPAFRWFDAAAERELEEQFGTQNEDVNYGPGYEQRLAARKKYAQQHWRFRAKMTSIWAAQRNTFNELTITVQTPGVEPFFLTLPSREAKSKLVQDQEYLFEATVVDYTKGLTRNFAGDVVTDPAAIAAGSAPPVVDDRRNVWHYVNAPKIFPNQTITEGIFRKQGVVWMEERIGGEPQDWKEIIRTPEYVELSRPLGDFLVRLYQDRSDYRRAKEPNWNPMFPGKWE